jgi:hypothetical protein
MKVSDEIRRIKNVLRKYSARSVVDLALAELWSDRGSKLDNLRAAPWITLLVAKWALQDSMVYMNIGPPIPVSIFNKLRQRVWELPAWRENPRDRPPRLSSVMRPMLQQQLEYQRQHGWGFLRWPALIGRRPRTDALWQHFHATLGMEPETYTDLAFALYATVLDGAQNVRDSFFDPLRPRYGAAVQRLLQLFVRDLPTLRAELQKFDATEVRGRSELYEFAYLRRFPFVRLSAGILTCWHPMVLARGLEDAVHLRLSYLGPKYTRPFSRLFERYVTELAIGAHSAVVTEDEYERRLGGDAPKVEAILQEESCNILIEAKMALFGDAVLVSDNAEVVYQKTKGVYKAVSQGWKVTRALTQTTNPYYRGSRDNFLLVVTSRQVHLGHGEMLVDLYPSDRLSYPDESASTRLPLRNVFILSIEEFERTMGAVRSGELKLGEFLREAAVSNEDPVKSRMYFAHYLEQHVKRFHTPSLITQALEESKSRLAEILPR